MCAGKSSVGDSRGTREHWLGTLSNFIDRNIRVFQYGIYSVGTLGLLITLRSLRTFSKFSQVSSIPSEFIQKKIQLHGRVVYVQLENHNKNIFMPPAGHSASGGEAVLCTDHTPTTGKAVLMIEHTPIISVRFLQPKVQALLPVHLIGVSVQEDGFHWLEQQVRGQHVKFRLLKVNSRGHLSCIVKKRKVRFWNNNAGIVLVRAGLGTVCPLDVDLDSETCYRTYYKKLLKAENWAEKKGLGMWRRETRTEKLNEQLRLLQSLSQVTLSVLQKILKRIRKSVS